MKTKQVIVIRKDLNMRKGKIAAQASHASNAVLLELIEQDRIHHHRPVGWVKVDPLVHPVVDWLNGSFTKICVYVNSEQELLDLYDRIRTESALPCKLIKDNGLTEFDGVPTYTCLAVGPWYVEDIDQFTGSLPLL